MKTRSKGLLTAFLIVALAIISVFAITPFTATADFNPSADFLTLSNAVEFAETGETGFVRVNLFSNGKIQRIPTVYRTDTLDLEFDGWYTQKNGAGTKADDNTIVDTYQIFYDHWVAREIEDSKKINSVNIPVASFIHGQTVLEWYNTCGLTTVEGIQSIAGYEIYNDLNAYGEKLADDDVIDVNKDYSVVTNLRLESGYYFDYGMSVTASNGIRAGVTYYNTEVNTNYWNSVATDLKVTINFPAEIGSDSFGFTAEPKSASLSEGDSYDYSFTLKGEPQSAELQLKNGENWIKIDDVDLLTSSGTITPRTGANVFRIFVNYANGSLYSNEFTVTWINPNDNEFTLQPISGSIKNGLDYNYTWACLHTPYSANLQRKDGEDWTDLGAVNGVVSYLDSYADTTQTFRISAIYGENQFASEEFTVEYKSTPLFAQQPMGQKVAIGSSYVVKYAVEKETYQEFSSSNSLLQVKNGDTWELASVTDIYLTEAVVPAQNTETTKVYRVGLRIGSTTLYSDEFTVTWVNDYTFDLDNDNLAWGEVAKADGYVEYEKIIKLMPTGTVFNNGTLMVSEPVNFGVYTWQSPFGYYLITYTPNSDLSAGEYTETVYVWSTSDGSDELCKTAVTLSITIVDAPSEFFVVYAPGEGNGSTDLDEIEAGATITLLAPADLDFTAQEGMTFSHWKVCKDNALDPNFVVKQPGDQITITFETYIIAVWKEIPTFFVVYAPGEGNGSTDLDSIYEGATITLLAPADLDFTAQEGMTFSHWKVCKDNALDPNFVVKQPGDEITITFETYIIAVWEEGMTYDVSFSANGGTGEMATVENVAGEYQLPTCDFTAPENHLFKAWAIGSLEGAQKQPGETITVDADTTIYAIWEELPEISEIPEATNVYVNGYPFATGNLYYKNGATETTADSSDWNAYYNLTKGELILKDFEGTSISLGGALATNLKIKLIGTNTITTSFNEAIYVSNNGNLTITADDDATLTINVTNSGNVVGISVGYSGSATAGTLTISGNANVAVTVNSTSDSASAYGIYARENVVIEDYASLKVVAKSNSTYGGISAGSGIYSESGNIEINTNEIVVSDASALGSTSYAMYAGDTPILTKAGSLILKWKGDSNCGPVNKDTVFDENGTINHAKNKDFENNVCSYVYGTPHYVTVFNGVAVVEDKNGETVCEINGGGYFVEGAVVTVKADATRNGHGFDSWLSKSTVADETLLETSVTVGDDDLILYANYDIFTVQPTFIKEGSNFYVTATLKASDISGFIVNENNLVLKSGEVDGVNAYVGNTENKVQVWDSTVPAGTYRYVVRYNGLNYYSDVFEVNYEIGELGDAPVILSVGGSEVDPETNMGGAPLIMIGQPYSAQVVATGNGLTYSAGVEDYMNLPAGLTINAETGLITGDCTVEIGTYNVSITVTNEWGSASAIILFIVADENCIPQIETEAGSLGTAYVDAISQFTVSAVDNSADFSIYNFGWTLKSGALPTGMSLTYTNSRTVYISGTPTEAGTFTFELEARNDVDFASRTFSITIEEGSVAPSLPAGDASLDDAVVGKAFQYQILATGTNTNEDPILFSTDNEDFGQESYDLGNGLSLSRTGLISGTPLEGGQVSFFVYAKNSAGIDTESYYVTVHKNGEATSIAVTPSVTVVAKGGSKEFTISLEGFGDVEQVAYWSFYMWDNDLGSAFPQPTDSTLSVNPSTPSGTVTLTVGENEERGQIRVVAYSKPGNNGIKTYATVTIVEKEDVIYTVSFSANGGEGAMASIPVVENENYTLPESTFTAPVGHQFKGWSVNGVEKAVGDQITVSADVEIKAVWMANAYTITFDTKDGSAVAPITQDYGTAIVAPADPTRVGYTFAGWDKAIPATMPAENMTINATWEINQYTITFDTKGGNAIDPITLNYGVSVVAPADPSRVGYTFAGWDKEIPATMPAEDITITATWEVNQYTIVFDTKGGSVIAPITQDYGTTVVAPANPTKDGFVFTGWDLAIPATMPAENMTINATWVEEIPDTYTVTYTDGVDGEVVFADQIIANLASGTATPSFEGTPSRDGYTFDGWTPEVADTVTESVTYTATWTLIPVHSHTDADGKWESDGTNHWHTCSCGEEFDKTACSGGEATCTERATCSTCGNAYGSVKAHDFGTEWKNDENNHWKECACGEKSEQGAHADLDENGACDTCGRELPQETPEIKPDEPEKDGLSGGAIAGIAVAGVAVAGMGGFAIFWFVIKKKTIADLIAIFKKK